MTPDQFKVTPEMLADPEVQRLLLPITLKFLAHVGITPMVDQETGETVVTAVDMAKAFGLTEDEVIEMAGPGVGIAVSSDRLKPIQ